MSESNETISANEYAFKKTVADTIFPKLVNDFKNKMTISWYMRSSSKYAKKVDIHYDLLPSQYNLYKISRSDKDRDYILSTCDLVAQYNEQNHFGMIYNVDVKETTEAFYEGNKRDTRIRCIFKSKY